MKMKSRVVDFWGRRYRITPRLIDKIFGDGKQTIYLTPLNTRPNYYIVQIDSKTDMDDDSWLDFLEEIQEEIEEEFGPCRGVRGGMIGFPAPDWDSGCCWGSAPENTSEAQNLRTTAAPLEVRFE
jgi:hypothetical protein